MSGSKIIAGLTEAKSTARKAGEIAFIIQEGREGDASATRTAYRILSHLGLCRFHEHGDPGSRDLTQGFGNGSPSTDAGQALREELEPPQDPPTEERG